MQLGGFESCDRRTSFPPTVSTRRPGKPGASSTAGLTTWGHTKAPSRRREYARILTELAAGNGVVTTPIPAPSSLASSATTSVFVSELILAYRRHAAEYYVKDGAQDVRSRHHQDGDCDVVGEMYGHSPVGEFGPLALTACQQKFIDQKLARSSVNKLVSRIRLMFRWGVAHQLVPESVHRALECVEGLRKGRTKAAETRKIRPVPDQIVSKASPFMPRPVAAMVQIQSFTGCRPGEIVIIRGCDLNMAGKIWEFRPAKFKTEHHEDATERVIYIGPKAQRVLKPWLRSRLERVPVQPDRGPRRAERGASREPQDAGVSFPCRPDTSARRSAEAGDPITTITPSRITARRSSEPASRPRFPSSSRTSYGIAWRPGYVETSDSKPRRRFWAMRNWKPARCTPRKTRIWPGR